MMVIDNSNCCFIDVDETLWIAESEDHFVPSKPNEKLIKKIREWKDQGKMIIVWTSNPEGVDHCKNIIYKCKIEEEVDYVMCKPRTIVDDDHLEYYSTIDPLTLRIR